MPVPRFPEQDRGWLALVCGVLPLDRTGTEIREKMLPMCAADVC